MTVDAISNVEGGLKTWLRDPLSPTYSLVGGRVFMGLPRGGPSTWPCLAIFRVGGGPTDGDYPKDSARIQINVWDLPGQKRRCLQVTKALITAVHDLACGTLLSDDVRVLGTYGITNMWLPDSDTGNSRYVVQFVIDTQAI